MGKGQQTQSTKGKRNINEKPRRYTTDPFHISPDFAWFLGASVIYLWIQIVIICIICIVNVIFIQAWHALWESSLLIIKMHSDTKQPGYQERAYPWCYGIIFGVIVRNGYRVLVSRHFQEKANAVLTRKSLFSRVENCFRWFFIAFYAIPFIKCWRNVCFVVVESVIHDDIFDYFAISPVSPFREHQTGEPLKFTGFHRITVPSPNAFNPLFCSWNWHI